MILFVDLESSDLLKKHLPLADEAQPWIVSIAAELDGTKDETLDFFSTRIRADGRKVREQASAVHGISSAQAARSGVPEVVALGMLCHLAAQAKLCVGYGLDFDRQVVESVLIRRGKDHKLWTRPGLQFVNLIGPAAQICKLPSDPPRDDGSYRWATLDKACEIILGEPARGGHHNAWDDMQRARRLFFALRDRNMLDLAKEAA